MFVEMFDEMFVVGKLKQVHTPKAKILHKTTKKDDDDDDGNLFISLSLQLSDSCAFTPIGLDCMQQCMFQCWAVLDFFFFL